MGPTCRRVELLTYFPSGIGSIRGPTLRCLAASPPRRQPGGRAGGCVLPLPRQAKERIRAMRYPPGAYRSRDRMPFPAESDPLISSLRPRQSELREVLRVRAGVAASVEDDALTVEEPLEIRVAGEAVSVTMRTPGHDTRLAVGFLFAEGVLDSIDDVGSAVHCGRPGEEGFGNVLDVLPAPGARLQLDALEAGRRGTLTTAACGVCGRRTVEDLLDRCHPVRASPPLDWDVIAAAPGRLGESQRTFAKTGGLHAAMALGPEGEVLTAFEDIGRHNAVDKVVGELLWRRLIGREMLERPFPAGPRPALLVISGRASFEMVQKAARAGIPVLASVSAASTLAVELADRLGITLCSFVREGRGNVHTHRERLGLR